MKLNSLMSHLIVMTKKKPLTATKFLMNWNWNTASKNIVFTHQSESDVNQAIDYIIGEFDDKGAAKKLYDGILQAIERIRLFPESGELVDNKLIKNRNVRKVLVGNYIMFYLFDHVNSTIVILRFVYGKRLIVELLKEVTS